ncbi:DUF805 domain-containing protein [Diaminobutyricimonas sp. LJ205]|uniref:DUF805 domain-containing protein n=1 Tax=Diaminobutyricimonas sp. LJ205 TaxID=2683590 RepID=UPI0012F4BA98|nr:DUF805 domain-containing protein [Diaminobutyricimonas sp. LJ205]
MNFGQAIASGFRNYVNFSGYARRSEFWFWTLFTALVSLVTNFVDPVTYWGDSSALNSLWSLAVLLPSLAVSVRRLRDSGNHWAWLFIVLVPLAGWIILIVLFCQPSVRTDAPSWDSATVVPSVER